MQIVYRDKRWELPGGMTARDLLKKLDLPSDTVLVVRDGKLVTDDTILRDDDHIKLVAVISGGRR
jgi:sulfur carrier protein ThiS